MSFQDLQQWLIYYPRLWIPAAVVGLVFAIVTGRKFFGGWSGFLESLRFWFQPGWLSAMRGEFWEDVGSEFKLILWFAAGMAVSLVAKIGMTKLVILYSLVDRWNLPI